MTPIRRLAFAASLLALFAGPLASEAVAKRYDPERCADVQRRISKARYEIHKNEGTGRHKDALCWFKKDLAKASAERSRYCGGGRGPWRWDAHNHRRDRYDPRYDRYDRYDDRYDRYGGYDRYDDDYDDRYDRYYEDSDGFDIKRDWPSLLGIFMNGGIGVGQ